MAIFRYRLHIWREIDEDNNPVNVAFFVPTRKFYKGDIIKVTGLVEADLQEEHEKKNPVLDIFFNKTPLMYNQKKEEYSKQDLELIHKLQQNDSYKIMVLKTKKIKTIRTRRK
jgi:DNA replicative helicase MCM subunit Mcm2 (Cdc46/Mcm family)